jgi:uncharacterized protein (DUF1800 family)
VKAKPQENFARELMELFTMGVGNYTEEDVYAAARVFTGWNLRLAGDRTSALTSYYEYVYNAAQHDPTAKTFTFAAMPDGSRTIPARPAADGEQDGLDLIRALARRPETADRLARRLFAYFVSEFDAPSQSLVNDMRETYLNNDTSIKAMLVRLVTSEEFLADTSEFARYSWPAEYVVRAIKETGWAGYSVDSALNPMLNMGQSLFEPPDVNGWDLGQGWFSTGAMLNRMNYAASLTTNQRINLRNEARPFAQTPQGVMSFVMERLSPATLETQSYDELLAYLRAGTNWTASDNELRAKVAGVMHLVLGSSYYQLV